VSVRPGDRQMIKEWNIALVLDIIRRHEPVSRVEIARLTQLGRSTISGIVGRLLREDLLEEVGSTSESGSGRRAVLLHLKARALAVVGVKLGPGGVVASLTDLYTEPIETVFRPLPGNADSEDVVTAVADAVEGAIDLAGYDRDRVLGVGLVVPGVVDPITGTSLNSYFPQWRRLPLRLLLEERLGQAVMVDNDANAVALAEHRFGAGRGVTHMLGVTVGVGIGAGCIINGRLHRGYRNGAGEIGHTTLDPYGPICVCGKRGCLDALAGDRALVDRAEAAIASGVVSAIDPLAQSFGQVTREIIVKAATVGDQLALELLSEAGERLGLALASAVDLVSPERIVVSGEAALQAGDLLLEPLRQSLARWVFGPLQGVEVVLGQLGTASWVRGAASLVLDEAFQVDLHNGPASPVALAGRVGSG
jgi:predicted NBD/HSP70 family sugar kinase